MEKSNEITIYKPCSICGRTFNPESLERHEKVCEKTKKGKQRKVFNSFQQRAKDIIVTPVKPENKVDIKKPKARWKEQHEQGSKKTLKCSENFMNNGWPSQKVIPLGYIQCPVCQRCFNHKAADRHIMWCQEQLSRLPKSPPSTEALQRLRARVKYRAPLPVKKRNASCENQRLIKSAESCKPPSLKRTFSSPGINQRCNGSKQVSFEDHPPTLRRSNSKTFAFSTKDCYDDYFGTYNTTAVKNVSPVGTPVMKFKEKFPNYSNPWKTSLCAKQFDNNNDRRNNYDNQEYSMHSEMTSRSEYDILNALQLQLAELDTSGRHFAGSSSTSDNFNSYYPSGSSSSRNSNVNLSTISLNDVDNYRSASGSRSWSSAGLAVNDDCGPKMPKFCYQCGTKYPVLEAKFCCECGAKRLIFGVSTDNTPVLTSP